jgi:hypothetical protein
MKTFAQFCTEAYDADFMSGAQIRKTGEGGRIGADRRLTDAERRRANPYKPRKDIGSQRQASTRVQEPEQARGSADVKAKAAAAAKAERIAAAKKRAAARSGGETPTTSKPKAKEVAQQASKLLSKKKSPEVDLRPADQPKRALQRKYTRADEKKLTRTGHRFAQELARQGEAERRGTTPDKIVLKKLTNAK